MTALSGFSYAYPVTSQTYSRKVDIDVLAPLASFGATAHKIATDIRLLASLKVTCIPFSSNKMFDMLVLMTDYRKLRSRSSPHRSDPLQWRTSGIRCAASVFVVSRATS